MMHEQMSQYYRFLGMNGYAERHDWHYNQENTTYKFIRDYYINHYNKLPPKASAINPNVIPDGWYRYSRDEVDASTKKSAVKVGLNTWKEWEEKTKEFYQATYYELINMKEIAFAHAMDALIANVDMELTDVISYCLKHKATDYDMDIIMSEQ